ncbi:hypothetical protein DX910_02390 [Acinetobacter haemolyticus]|nr:hypothetical protein DX910_02390 [Acinetobacter haemolyticus]
MTEEINPKQIRFAELIASVQSGQKAAIDYDQELKQLAIELGAKTETREDYQGQKRNCYWIYQNNFACNPNNPPPNCNCRQVCL